MECELRWLSMRSMVSALVPCLYDASIGHGMGHALCAVVPSVIRVLSPARRLATSCLSLWLYVTCAHSALFTVSRIPLYIMVCTYMDVWSKIVPILVYLTAACRHSRRTMPFTHMTVTHASRNEARCNDRVREAQILASGLGSCERSHRRTGLPGEHSNGGAHTCAHTGPVMFPPVRGK